MSEVERASATSAEVSASPSLIEIRNLHKRFETGTARIDVLNGLDLTLEVGDRVAIVGQSGVGKSTFLHILGTLDRPTTGSVRFEGEEVFDLPADEMARMRNRFLGFVFQFHHLLPEFSAVENVMMPGLLQGRSRGEMHERASRILGEVELSARLDHSVGKLSGGERQRVAVARALVLEPPVVLADEPTGNLDPKTGDHVAELLFEMNRRHQTTLVVVTHSEGMAEKLGTTLTLMDGRLVDGAGFLGSADSAAKSR
ncbi:MAG: ABC transporter ATP-binding protein [Myxococcota bacterium]|nr:ABC transporter ATP-binding protein [Myxococcota bacterium]